MMIGQTNLISQIDRLTLSTFPHSLILVGEEGCGKHTLVSYISQKFSLEVVDLSGKITPEIIDEIYGRPDPYIYQIDASKLTVKDENSALKFIEEPLKNSYIIILCDNLNQLIPTIVNRCCVWSFGSYSREELLSFVPDYMRKDSEFLLQYSRTPGQILQLVKYSLEDLMKVKELAEKIFKYIDTANIPNTLTISNKLAYKDTDKEKIEVNLFLRFLLFVSGSIALQTPDTRYVKAYALTSKLYQDCKIPHVSCKYLIEHYLIDLKYTLKEVTA